MVAFIWTSSTDVALSTSDAGPPSSPGTSSPALARSRHDASWTLAAALANSPGSLVLTTTMPPSVLLARPERAGEDQPAADVPHRRLAVVGARARHKVLHPLATATAISTAALVLLLSLAGFAGLKSGNE